MPPARPWLCRLISRQWWRKDRSTWRLALASTAGSFPVPIATNASPKTGWPARSGSQTRAHHCARFATASGLAFVTIVENRPGCSRPNTPGRGLIRLGDQVESWQYGKKFVDQLHAFVFDGGLWWSDLWTSAVGWSCRATVPKFHGASLCCFAFFFWLTLFVVVTILL